MNIPSNQRLESGKPIHLHTPHKTVAFIRHPLTPLHHVSLNLYFFLTTMFFTRKYHLI
ncbi:hypothetical protein Hanom_Chr09g00867121 [Helianthus anomalus]